MSRRCYLWSLFAFFLLTGCSVIPSAGLNSKAAHPVPVNKATSSLATQTQSTILGNPLTAGKTPSVPTDANSTTSATGSKLHPPNAKPTFPVLTLNAKSTWVVRLQQRLADLHYLPVAYSTSIGWSWRYTNVPPSLRSLWVPGLYTSMTEGAVMSFERVNGLAVDGVAGPQVWQALQADVAKDASNPHGYAYVYVSKQAPERLLLWYDGRDVLRSLANTGISQSPTPDGTWPVYLRFTAQTMSGTDPNGTHYNDPGVPWVNYFYQGDAVHGFTRSFYGSPQSLGCVELPPADAKAAWGFIHYGTLVTVAH